MRWFIHRFRFLVLPLVMLTFACGGNAVTTLPASPEGKIAVYGERFATGLRDAQRVIIAWADASGNQAVAAPAVRVFIEVGKRGQELADVLDLIDKTNVTAEKQSLALRARGIISVIVESLTTVAVDLGNLEARKRVADAIMKFVNSPLYTLVEMLGPLVVKMTTSTTATPTLVSRPV
jgi:hypothetical protein